MRCRALLGRLQGPVTARSLARRAGGRGPPAASAGVDERMAPLRQPPRIHPEGGGGGLEGGAECYGARVCAARSGAVTSELRAAAASGRGSRPWSRVARRAGRPRACPTCGASPPPGLLAGRRSELDGSPRPLRACRGRRRRRFAAGAERQVAQTRPACQPGPPVSRAGDAPTPPGTFESGSGVHRGRTLRSGTASGWRVTGRRRLTRDHFETQAGLPSPRVSQSRKNVRAVFSASEVVVTRSDLHHDSGHCQPVEPADSDGGDGLRACRSPRTVGPSQ